MTKTPSEFGEQFFTAMLSGGLSPKNKAILRRKLWKLARARLREMRDLWSNNVYDGTFLSLFMKGPSAFPNNDFLAACPSGSFLPKRMPDGFYDAVGDFPVKQPAAMTLPRSLKVEDLSLQEAVGVMIEDFLEYCDFVIFWRHFIASVRVLLNQQRGSDDADWLVPPELRC